MTNMYFIKCLVFALDKAVVFGKTHHLSLRYYPITHSHTDSASISPGNSAHGDRFVLNDRVLLHV